MVDIEIKRYEHEPRGWDNAIVDRVISTERVQQGQVIEAFVPMEYFPKGPNSTLPILRRGFNYGQVLTVADLVAQRWIAQSLLPNQDIYPFEHSPLQDKEAIYCAMEFNEYGMLLYSGNPAFPTQTFMAAFESEDIRQHLHNRGLTGIEMLVAETVPGQGPGTRRALRHARLVPTAPTP